MEMNPQTFADGGMVGSVAGRQILFGILSILNGKWTRTESYDVATKLSARHDFICFYSGVCPMGYNNFTDRDYADHPQIGTVVQNGYGNYSLGDGLLNVILIPAFSKVANDLHLLSALQQVDVEGITVGLILTLLSGYV
ncbi:unnamed protein product [Toxocara canis]|uniref:Porin n=1 Tax=Toxocara canis TaxID=6265 RepID=A0A183V1L8_TOXCA|nr:unnamed protein product [Toxocara canis]